MNRTVSIALALLLASVSLLAAEGDAPAVTAPSSSFLFVQNATSGEMILVEGTDDVYSLVLRGVSPSTVYFSDRPERIVGQVPTGRFLEGLGFADDNPPNAALDLAIGNKSDIVVVELRNPRYDGNLGELRYDVQVLKTAEGALAEFSGRNVAAVPATFEGASLFIDDCADDQLYCYRRSDTKYVGKITVGFCWSFGQIACHPCHKFSSYNDQCNSDYKVCGGDCFADDQKQ
jgi:hypothetical protein